jgi:hypothetical protein
LPAGLSHSECLSTFIIRDYERGHPGPGDIAMIVDVADSSLPEDRTMADVLYGPAGIPVNGTVDLLSHQVEVYTDPTPEGYRSRVDFQVGEYPSSSMGGWPARPSWTTSYLHSRLRRNPTAREDEFFWGGGRLHLPP